MQLKNISLDLQQFMKHSVTYLTHFQPNILSPVSVSFISTLFHKLHNANIKWLHEYDTIINTKTNWPADITHLLDYNYIPELIRKTIESVKRETIFQRQFTLDIGDKTFHIMIWFPTFIKTNQSIILMSDLQIQDKVNRTLQKIYIWLSIAISYIPKNTKCSKNVNIFLFLTDHIKLLPTNSNDNIIQQINANTAFTTGCVNKQTNICIYREEEWFKVLIHETMHNLGLDFIDIANTKMYHKIHKVFPISVQDIRLYETYSEMWANIMNIIFVVYFTDKLSKKGRLPIVRWTQLFTKRLYLEQLFSLFQATKVLIFNKLKYSDLFIIEKAQLYKEETHVFSYYILKSIWLLNINSFFEFCVSQKNGVSLKFNLSQYNLDKFINILIKNAHNPLYINSINDMYNFYIQGKDNKHNHKNIPFAKTTLRMTLQELI
jgi:hypothetical protein